VNIQNVAPAHLPEILQLNQNAMPMVNSLTPDLLRWLAETAPYFRAAWLDDRLAGFLVALDETSTYASPFFDWFRQRYPRFIYLDRIVVADWTRRRGVGLALLADVAEFTQERGCPLASDLYADNDASLAFHHKFGFEEVGRQIINAKTVLKLLKPGD